MIPVELNTVTFLNPKINLKVPEVICSHGDKVNNYWRYTPQWDLRDHLLIMMKFNWAR